MVSSESPSSQKKGGGKTLGETEGSRTAQLSREGKSFAEISRMTGRCNTCVASYLKRTGKRSQPSTLGEGAGGSRRMPPTANSAAAKRETRPQAKEKRAEVCSDAQATAAVICRLESKVDALVSERAADTALLRDLQSTVLRLERAIRAQRVRSREAPRRLSEMMRASSGFAETPSDLSSG